LDDHRSPDPLDGFGEGLGREGMQRDREGNGNGRGKGEGRGRVEEKGKGKEEGSERKE